MSLDDKNYARMYAQGSYYRRAWFHKWSLAAAQKMQIHLRSGNLLDVGCGPGHVSSWFACKGYDVTGIDSDPYMIAEAQAIWKGVTFKQADARTLDKDAEWENIVCLHDVINAIEDKEDALCLLMRQFHDRLADGGKLIFDLTTSLGFDSWNEVQIQDKPDYFKLDRGMYNQTTGVASIAITGFFQEHNDGPFSRFQKTVNNYYHPPSYIYTMLKDCGFSVEVFPDDFAAPMPHTAIETFVTNKLFFNCRRS
jgi:SAM-dependent methyltransferase